jgi:hypothetical protein
MYYVVPVETVGIAKDCGCFLKRDAMFLEVGMAFGMSHVNAFVYIH